MCVCVRVCVCVKREMMVLVMHNSEASCHYIVIPDILACLSWRSSFATMVLWLLQCQPFFFRCVCVYDERVIVCAHNTRLLACLLLESNKYFLMAGLRSMAVL